MSRVVVPVKDEENVVSKYDETGEEDGPLRGTNNSQTQNNDMNQTNSIKDAKDIVIKDEGPNVEKEAESILVDVKSLDPATAPLKPPSRFLSYRRK